MNNYRVNFIYDGNPGWMNMTAGSESEAKDIFAKCFPYDILNVEHIKA